jgi:hypothetical protein
MKGKNDFNLKFELMLRRALDLWPAEIDVGALTYTNKARMLYSVQGLHECYESIISSYDNSAMDFLMINLHWSILRVVHKAALSMNRVNTGALRAEAIEEQFDGLLNKIRTTGTPEFEDDVITLSERYFLENKK